MEPGAELDGFVVTAGAELLGAGAALLAVADAVDFDGVPAAEVELEALPAEAAGVVSALFLCEPEQAVASSNVAATAPASPRPAGRASLVERERSCMKLATILTAKRLTTDSPESSPDELSARGEHLTQNIQEKRWSR